MSTDETYGLLQALFWYAMMVLGSTALAGFILFYVLGAITGAGESGSGEEIPSNDGDQEGE